MWRTQHYTAVTLSLHNARSLNGFLSHLWMSLVGIEIEIQIRSPKREGGNGNDTNQRHNSKCQIFTQRPNRKEIKSNKEKKIKTKNKKKKRENNKKKKTWGVATQKSPW